MEDNVFDGSKTTDEVFDKEDEDHVRDRKDEELEILKIICAPRFKTQII